MPASPSLPPRPEPGLLPFAAPADLAERLAATRAATLRLIAPLSEEDCQVQSMDDASPAKWHLAHTTWLFETFVLEAFEPGFVPFDTDYRMLFNSYYHAIGPQHARPRRGLITRPSLREVLRYRAEVETRVLRLLERSDGPPQLSQLVWLGVQHEQQHQELMLTDILHLLSCHPCPTQAVYAPDAPQPALADPALRADLAFEGGLVRIGHAGDGFAFDNESPVHKVWLEPFVLRNQLVSETEWLEFVLDGGYRQVRWWLSAGWDWVQRLGIAAPAYWRQRKDGAWVRFSLRGEVPLSDQAPVVHISLYEAAAYSAWLAHRTGASWRLPTEAEWEHAVLARPDALQQVDDAAWQWTQSAYLPYPGFRPWDGPVQEYNGKFMAEQMVLRGGSCATPAGHARVSYRNFFPAGARWQFSGLRLAR